MTLEADLLGAFEEHSPAEIRSVLDRGASPTALVKGKTPIDSLIEGYLRSERFAECVRVLLDAGASIDDPALEAVLLDDDATLARLLGTDGRAVMERPVRVPCAFTSCDGVSLLHLCAEHNSVRCARVLLDAGADANAAAELDAEGFGGQTPIFHAVNSIFNFCRPMMELLAESGAALDVRVKGLIWGPGQSWETLVLDATPLSYAQCGLYPQFQRPERDVYGNLAYLHQRRWGTALTAPNVPNRYLTPGA